MGWRDDPEVPGGPAAPSSKGSRSWRDDLETSETVQTPEPSPAPKPSYERTSEPYPSILGSAFSNATGGGVDTRPGYEMTGAMAGAAAGAGAGIPGMIAGGALGAGAGSLVFDTTDSLLRYLNGSEPRPNAGPVDSAKRAFKAGVEDAGWSTGFAALRPAKEMIQRGVGKALGLRTEEARIAADAAASLPNRVDLGPTHVSDSGIAKGAPKVIGVFPFAGTPYRSGQERVVGQLDKNLASYLNELAPHATAAEVGQQLTKGAVEEYGKFNTLKAAFYKSFDDAAKMLPPEVADIVPTATLRQAVKDIEENAARSQIALLPKSQDDALLGTLSDVTLTSGETMKKFGADPVGVWMTQLNDLPERITVEQARGLERELNEIARRAKNEGYDVSRLGAVKAALTDAKNSLDVSRLPPEIGQEILNRWNKANEFYHQTKKIFETPTAQKFGRVDKNMFGAGIFKPGSINDDEVFRTVFRANSPAALEDLRKLVGPEKFRLAAREYIEHAVDASRIKTPEGSSVPELFSAADFKKRMKLDTEDGWQSFTEMLKGSPVKAEDWKQFLDVAERATHIEIRDPSTFVARRMILAGGTYSGLVGGLVAGGGAGGGVVSIPAAVALTYAMKGTGRLLMDPSYLRNMTRILSPDTSNTQKKLLLAKFLEAGEDDGSPPEQTGTTLPQPRGGTSQSGATPFPAKTGAEPVKTSQSSFGEGSTGPYPTALNLGSLSPYDLVGAAVDSLGFAGDAMRGQVNWDTPEAKLNALAAASLGMGGGPGTMTSGWRRPPPAGGAEVTKLIPRPANAPEMPGVQLEGRTITGLEKTPSASNLPLEDRWAQQDAWRSALVERIEGVGISGNQAINQVWRHMTGRGVDRPDVFKKLRNSGDLYDNVVNYVQKVFDVGAK